jgi:catalase (peroxidase I)
MALRIRRPTLTTVGLAFGVGAITAAAWAAFTKRNIERTYRAGAADLRSELETRGGALRQEIAQLASSSAVEAVRDELADFGVTAGMLDDLQTAVAAAAAVRQGARRTGQTVQRYIERLR